MVRAIDAHPSGTDDDTHFQTAADQGRVLLSEDDDMIAIAVRWQVEGKAFPGLVFCHAEKLRATGEAIRALQALVDGQGECPLASRVLYL